MHNLVKIGTIIVVFVAATIVGCTGNNQPGVYTPTPPADPTSVPTPQPGYSDIRTAAAAYLEAHDRPGLALSDIKASDHSADGMEYEIIATTQEGELKFIVQTNGNPKRFEVTQMTLAGRTI